MARYPLSELVRAKTHIMREFSGPFPLARINCFTVMHLVLDVWKEIVMHVTKANAAGLPDDMRGWSEFAKDHSRRVRGGGQRCKSMRG
jgi:hypothetical protein